MAIIIETCPICGHDLIKVQLTAVSSFITKECRNCGWSWCGTQEEEEIIRIPFVNNTSLVASQNVNTNVNTRDCIPECCKNCSNYLTGSGYTVCGCTKPYMTK